MTTAITTGVTTTTTQSTHESSLSHNYLPMMLSSQCLVNDEQLNVLFPQLSNIDHLQVDFSNDNNNSKYNADCLWNGTFSYWLDAWLKIYNIYKCVCVYKYIWYSFVSIIHLLFIVVGELAS